MAIRYRYETSTGGQQARKMVIPESPDEELRGDTFTEENIDWLHRSERQKIDDAVAREQAEEDRRAEARGEAPEKVELVKVWTEKVDA